MQKLSFLYLVECSLFDTNSRRFKNVAFLSLFCHEKLQSFRGGKDLFPTAKLTWWHFLHFFLLQSIGVSILYGLELVLKVSFRVRNRFRIRINNVMSIWQLATTVAAILVLPICHSRGFTFVLDELPFIYRSVDVTIKPIPKNNPVVHCQRRYSQASSPTSEWRIVYF